MTESIYDAFFENWEGAMVRIDGEIRAGNVIFCSINPESLWIKRQSL